MTMIYALSGGTEYVKARSVPKDVPEELCQFINRFTKRDALNRPDWQVEDFCETIKKVRREAFGRKSSGMKPIPGFSMKGDDHE